MRCHTLSAALALAAVTVAAAGTPVAPAPAEQQHVFGAGPDSHLIAAEAAAAARDDACSPTGVLKRYPVADLHDMETVLGLAAIHDLDVWHAGPAHVDVFVPTGAAPAPAPDPLAARVHTATPVSFAPPPAAAAARSADDGDDPWQIANLSGSPFHGAYHPLTDVAAFTAALAAHTPERLTLVPLGHSAQGREMVALRVSSSDAKDARSSVGKKKGGKQVPKRGVVVMGPQHAREWVGGATALYLAHALITNTSDPGSLGDLLERYDFYIIPMPNPDGYAYTWETDRLWYKNRQILGPAEKCVGLDMNRNWGYKWRKTVDGAAPSPFLSNVSSSSSSDLGKGGKTKPKPGGGTVDPCSPWYPGRRAFESPEASGVANFVQTLPDLVAFVDLRAYGQMLSAPYSYSCKRTPKDAEDQLEAALGAASAIHQAHGTAFTTGQLCQTLYRAHGNVVDYMYARAGIKYAYAVHLRDTGTYGFALPAQWIRPVGEETANMVRYLTAFISTKADG